MKVSAKGAHLIRDRFEYQECYENAHSSMQQIGSLGVVFDVFDRKRSLS